MPGRLPRVWTWSDLWAAVREGSRSGPDRLSDAGAHAALVEAIDQARRDGALGVSAGVADWPGFRSRLRGRIAGWTRSGLRPDRSPPDPGPSARDDWAVFGRYRSLLRAIEAEDEEGFALWAASTLRDSPPPALRKLGIVTVLDLEADSPAVDLALKFFEARAKEVRVTLSYGGDPALAEPDSAFAPVRGRLLDRGYLETGHAPDLWRPAGLRDLEREVFRTDAHGRTPVASLAGLRLLGAPQGEGVGLVVAREVADRLAGGVAPDDLMVLIRSWDESAEVLLDVLRSWGLPVSPLGRPADLAGEPAVSAVREALRLPRDGWEVASLVRFLRSGRLAPAWEVGRSFESRAWAAAWLRETGVFRGVPAVRAALDANFRAKPDLRPKMIEARTFIDRVVTEVEALDQPGRWRAHAGRLKAFAESLGIGAGGDPGLERFWDALDDYAAVRDAARPGADVSFEAFAGAIDGLVVASGGDEPAHRPGTVAVATVNEATGARGRCVVLANLAEGTFPAREAVEGADDADDPSRVGPGFAREMARFLRVIGSADRELVLAYPTRDEKGQVVLPAGFLDDVFRRIEPDVLERTRVNDYRFDPFLLEHEDLARSPADARVRAVALACVRHEPGRLAGLAGDPRHREVLEGTAAALLLGRERFGGRDLTRFEGRLDDPAAASALAERFGPSHVFSPSQLETYLACPFQFFFKYVLKIKPVHDGDDLDEDYVARGNRVHELLEQLERLWKQGGGDRLDLADVLIRNEMRVELATDSETAPGLRAIDELRLTRTIRQYVGQAAVYDRDATERPARPHLFEVEFGDDPDGGHPHLEVGGGSGAVRIRGKIDRVDLVDLPTGPAFRVIDYKTGACPPAADVRNMAMVQLPLYALAVEQLGLVGGATGLLDVGYWGLREKGYKAIKLGEWGEIRDRLEAEVIRAAGRLRGGLFVVQPRHDDCTARCDFATACRIGQVRAAGKTPAGEGPS